VLALLANGVLAVVAVWESLAIRHGARAPEAARGGGRDKRP